VIALAGSHPAVRNAGPDWDLEFTSTRSLYVDSASQPLDRIPLFPVFP